MQKTRFYYGQIFQYGGFAPFQAILIGRENDKFIMMCVAKKTGKVYDQKFTREEMEALTPIKPKFPAPEYYNNDCIDPVGCLKFIIPEKHCRKLPKGMTVPNFVQIYSTGMTMQDFLKSGKPRKTIFKEHYIFGNKVVSAPTQDIKDNRKYDIEISYFLN